MIKFLLVLSILVFLLVLGCKGGGSFSQATGAKAAEAARAVMPWSYSYPHPGPENPCQFFFDPSIKMPN